MGIFTRFKDIVNANINALLDKAEDPEKMLKLMIQEMEDTIIELKSTCNAKMAEKQRTETRVKEQEACIERWLTRAKLALEHDNEDLAREALVEKRNAIEILDKTEDSLKSINSEIEKNKEEISTLDSKLSQAKAKLKTLQNMKENASHSFDPFKREFDDASWSEFTKKYETEEKFSSMEKDVEIEEELEALKKEKGKQ